jgi:hypothetical protein
MVAFCRLALDRPRLEIKTSARCWREFSSCYVAAMSRMSFTWWYTLSTLAMEGASKVYRSTATAAMFWQALVKAGCCVPSRLMGAVRSLA